MSCPVRPAAEDSDRIDRVYASVRGSSIESPRVTEAPLALDQPGATAELRDVLLAAGFTGEGVRAALRSGADVLARLVDVALHERRLAGNEPLGTLIRLLVLESAVADHAAKRAFAPLGLDRVERLGLVERRAGEVLPLVRIVPHDDLLIASDRRVEGGVRRADHVAGVHAPSLTLSHLTLRRPVQTALDVGTGNGIQAILAARHSARVVATDVNARALRFAAFNAQLNGVENLDVREGSFFDPVAGERFELVTCNPPYVVSPESAYLFRDSGMEGDAVSRHVIERAPASLEEGAFASMLVSWAVPPGEHWSTPLRSWLEGSGCDVWLLHNRTDDPLTHAGNWLRHEVGDDADAYAEALDRWLAYFARLGIDGIAVGAVILRRRAGRNWVVTDELPAERLGPASDHILRVFAAQDLLHGLADDRALLAERLVLDEHALLEQRVVYADRQWNVANVELALQDGLGFNAGLDATTAGMLAALDGTRTLGDVLDDLGRLEGLSRGDVERALLPIARRMLSAGFLVRASGTDSSIH
jgi:methylase of polypeptide subunit release factors